MEVIFTQDLDAAYSTLKPPVGTETSFETRFDWKNEQFLSRFFDKF